MDHQATTIDHHEASVTPATYDIEERMPSGWWILPSALLGPFLWYVIIRAIASQF